MQQLLLLSVCEEKTSKQLFRCDTGWCSFCGRVCEIQLLIHFLGLELQPQNFDCVVAGQKECLTPPRVNMLPGAHLTVV